MKWTEALKTVEQTIKARKRKQILVTCNEGHEECTAHMDCLCVDQALAVLSICAKLNYGK